MQLTRGIAVTVTALAAAFAASTAAGASTPASAAQPGDQAASALPAPVPQARHACSETPPKGYAACMSLVRTDIKSRTGSDPLITPAGYGPSDFQSAYDLPSATAGAGNTVALVDAYDDPNAESDLAAYRSQYGLPACTTANGCFRKVNQNGAASPLPPAEPPGQDWALEDSLDMDMVSAICPNCHIDLVEGNDNSFASLGAAENSAVVTLGAQYVSNSYGGTESSGETGLDASYYNHPGTVITASAGDSGYGTEYPAASSDVVAVGGTSLTRASTPRGWTESVWGTSGGGAGTGSGCSGYETKPAWQANSLCANRTLDDVSADADPSTGAAVYDTYDAGGWVEVGGTSESSPIIASVYALAGTPAASTYPASYIYARHGAADINDVTTGANGTCAPAGLCTAGTGYDGPTGWGTPNYVCAFTQAACATPAAPTVTGVAPNNGPTGGHTAVTVSGTNLAGGSVKFGSVAAISASCAATSCTATSPAESAGTVDVTVTTTAGTSAPSAADHFTYTTSPPPPPSGPIKGYGGKCVDDHGSSTADGNPIDIWTCNGTAAQTWTVAANGTLQVLGKCMNITGAHTTSGTKIILYTCSSAWNEQWKHQSNGELVNPHSGMCLNDPGYSTVNGKQLIIWSCVNTANEHWTIP